jgi:hypothetical protein
MNHRTATVWIVAGVPVAIIDAWLSMQAMFGILDPRNFLSYTVAVVSGMFFTTFAVLSETFGMRKNILGLLAWVVLFIVDMSTSVLCAVWYGLFGHPFSQRIQISRIRFDPSHWPLTSIYIAFVVLAALGCIQLGRAFETLLERTAGRH